MIRVLLAMLSLGLADAATFKTIYQFGDSTTPMGLPAGRMVQDSHGVLYGTTIGSGGAFFSLSPPASPGAQWTAAVLYEFGVNAGDGAGPDGVASGPGGALYGVTGNGGAYGEGTVFQLTPPPSPGGSWAETVLWSFGSPGDGESPAGPIAIDANGVIHGVTIGGGSFRDGTAFTLAPPASGGAWSETVVHSFGGTGDGCHPASIVLDAGGTAYGTTSSECNGAYGTVFSISPSQSETVIYSFAEPADGSSPASVIVGAEGTLYGVTYDGGKGYGTVFSLTNQSGSWQEAVIYSFPGVDGSPKQGYSPHSLTLSASGTIYGVASAGGLGTGQPLRRHPGYGVVFKLGPPASPDGSWQFRLLHAFHGASDGEEPLCNLILDPNGTLYGTTAVGGAGNLGTAFLLAP